MYSNQLLPSNMKSINPMQKYQDVVESYACILYIFVIILLFPINFPISLRIVSTPKTCYILIINIQNNLLSSY